MKIIHLADSHLGYSAYRKITEEGINQREIDVYDAFTQCIDYAVKTKPDIVLHAGDLFDSVRPTNRAITVAIQQILRLSKENIPFVVISGNHETPRLKETGNIFNIFEHLEHVYPVYNNCYEAIPLKTEKETIVIHAIPQCQTPKEFTENLKKVKPDETVDFNILMAHGAVTGIQAFKMNEFNELFIPVQSLQKKFDYIALGHYHTCTKLQENVFYSGSLEHMTFTEAADQKGLIEINLGKKLQHRFIPIKTRPMIDVPSLDCLTLSIEQIIKNIKDTIRTIEPKDKIIRIRLDNIPSHIQRGLDFQQIRELSKGAVHFEMKTSPIKTSVTFDSENSQIKSLADEFEKFLSTQQLPEKNILLSLGLEYIYKIVTKDEGK